MSVWGSISQSRFVCQVVCSSIQGIYSWLVGGPSAKVGLSAKLCVPVDLPGDLPIWAGGTSARTSAKISFNNSITYNTWQIWTLIDEICNYLVGDVLQVFWRWWRCWGGYIWYDCTMLTVYYPNYSEITGNSHLFLKNTKWLPIHPIIYIPWCIWGVDLLADLGVDLPIAILDH